MQYHEKECNKNCPVWMIKDWLDEMYNRNSVHLYFKKIRLSVEYIFNEKGG